LNQFLPAVLTIYKKMAITMVRLIKVKSEKRKEVKTWLGSVLLINQSHKYKKRTKTKKLAKINAYGFLEFLKGQKNQK